MISNDKCVQVPYDLKIENSNKKGGTRYLILLTTLSMKMTKLIPSTGVGLGTRYRVIVQRTNIYLCQIYLEQIYLTQIYFTQIHLTQIYLT